MMARIGLTWVKIKLININDVIYNMKSKAIISIDRDLANKLKSMKKVGETYSDIIWKLLEVK